MKNRLIRFEFFVSLLNNYLHDFAPHFSPFRFRFLLFRFNAKQAKISFFFTSKPNGFFPCFARFGTENERRTLVPWIKNTISLNCIIVHILVYNLFAECKTISSLSCVNQFYSFLAILGCSDKGDICVVLTICFKQFFFR
jgi:hypothetical protein